MNFMSNRTSYASRTSSKSSSILFQNTCSDSKHSADTREGKGMVIQNISWQSVEKIPLADVLEDRYGHVFANWVMERVQ